MGVDCMEDNPSSSDNWFIGQSFRREFLKTVGSGVGTAAVLTGTATAQPQQNGITNGPFTGTYEPSTVDPTEINEFDGDGTEPDGEGEGEEIDKVVPRQAPETDGTPTGGGGSAQTDAATGGLVETDFDGLDATDARGVVPPDPQIAANGGGDLIEVINSQIAFFDDEGEQTFQSTLDAFFAPATPNIDEENPGDGFFESYIIFDPRARFDHDSGRFLVLCVDFEFAGGTGGYLLGVSSSSDPMEPWNLYYIRPTGADGPFGPGLVDFPQLGYDEAAIYLTQNFFPGPFTQATLEAVDKSAAVNGNSIDVNHFTNLQNPDGSVAFTVQPSDGGGYFANSIFFQGQTLTLWSIADPTGDASLSNDFLRVNPYTNPTEGAEQPNTEKKIDMIDDRVQRVSFDGDHLWAVHTIDDGRVRWYELDPDASAVVQSNDFRVNGEKTFMAAIAAADEDAVFVYNTSSPRNDAAGFVDVGVASIDGGRVDTFETVAEGENGYNYVSERGTATLRWGDYSGAVRDPSGDGFWIVGEYAKQIRDEPVDPFYGTRIAKITPE